MLLLTKSLLRIKKYLIQNDNLVSILEVVYLVRDEQAGALAQQFADAVVKEQPPHVRIHC